MRTFYILAFICIGICFQACNIINPKEPTPTYVHVDSFLFVPGNPAIEGTSSHKISCIWVYYNNSPVGVFDLPCTFPVLTSGNSGLLTIVPGITVDGLNAYQAQYPFYTGDTTTLTTAAGQVLNYLPKTGYNQAAHFIYKEDFEVGNSLQKISGDTPIVLVSDPGLVGFGKHSGYIDMLTANDSSENITQNPYPFTTGLSYVELNYKNSVPFFVGVDVIDATGALVTAEPEYIIGISPSSSWNKIYISLITPASKYLSLFPGSKFRLAIKSVVPDGQNSGYVLLDNIKIITD